MPDPGPPAGECQLSLKLSMVRLIHSFGSDSFEGMLASLPFGDAVKLPDHADVGVPGAYHKSS